MEYQFYGANNEPFWKQVISDAIRISYCWLSATIRVKQDGGLVRFHFITY